MYFHQKRAFRWTAKKIVFSELHPTFQNILLFVCFWTISECSWKCWKICLLNVLLSKYDLWRKFVTFQLHISKVDVGRAIKIFGYLSLSSPPAPVEQWTNLKRDSNKFVTIIKRIITNYWSLNCLRTLSSRNLKSSIIKMCGTEASPKSLCF